MFACGNGHKDVVKLLLDHSERIELNATTAFGETAFMFACRYGRKDVVELLLHHSEIDKYVRNNDGRTASMVAKQYGRGHQDIVYFESKSSRCIIL